MYLKTLYDRTPSPGILSTALQVLYDGDLTFTKVAESRPFIFGNFVQTLDGIVSLKIPGLSGGGDISGRNEEDTFIMGLLRSYADAVLIGEETYRVAQGHLWTADFIYPKLKDEFQGLRRRLDKRRPYPLTVIVSGKGTVDLNGALFKQSDVKSVVFTTKKGKEYIEHRHGTTLPCDVHVLPGDTLVNARDIAAQLYDVYGVKQLLHEGGSMLFSSFLQKGLLDELFLSIAPQIVGRGISGERPNFAGQLSFGPEQALWGTLLSIKSATTSHLFLRYRFEPKNA
jgi:riboflavin biosynthesis pyrimidine reductase